MTRDDSGITNVVAEVRTHLIDYLKEKGIELKKNGTFSCFIPDCEHTHEDANPSAGIVPGTNNEVFHCFKSQISGDIFHAAHFLEGYPIHGNEFYTQTLPYFAEKYGIEYETYFSDAELATIDRKKAYMDVARYVYNNLNEKYIEDRGWTKEQLAIFMVGSIKSKAHYIDTMLKLGWNETFLNENGLLTPEIFSRDRLIFPIKNRHGSVIAFASRWMNYDPDNPDASRKKYYNSANSIIYRKSLTLYNLNNIRKHTDFVWIFEGYTDVITAHIHGIQNCVALGCKTLTDEHMDLLRSHSINKIILCLDADAVADVEKAIENVLSHSRDFHVRIVQLPNKRGFSDPDEYIRKMGAASFTDLECLSPFKWKLNNSNLNDERLGINYDLAKTMINEIAMEPSSVQRHEMINELSRHTNVPLDAIEKDVNMRLNEQEFQKQEKLMDIARRAMREIDHGRDPRIVFEDSIMKMKDVEKQYRSSIETEDDFYLTTINELEEKFKTQEGYGGLDIGYPLLTQYMDGLQEGVVTVAGVPNIGKTTFLRNIVYRIITKHDNIFCLYMSIDDSLNKMLPAMAAMISDLSIDEVKHPRDRKMFDDKKKKERWQRAWSKLREMKDRFVIKDARDGTTLDDLRRHIECYKEKYPDKEMVVLLDNFHKLTDYGKGSGGIREKNILCSKRIKDFTVYYSIPIVMTVELRKVAPGVRPTTRDIAETVQIDYDQNVCWLLYSDFHDRGDRSSLFWSNGYEDPNTHSVIKMPILEVTLGKNKEGSFHGTLFYKLDPHKSWIEEATVAEMSNYHQIRERQMKNKKSIPKDVALDDDLIMYRGY